MIFHATRLEDVRLVELEPSNDDRGFFARIWCSEEMAKAGLDPSLAQSSLSHTRTRGTVRGLHIQRAPHEETKLVRCVRGAIFDVVVDLRRDSKTYLGWQSFELSAANRLALYVPKGLAHGFQTLQEDTEVIYQISTPYCAQAATGHRYDDPSFGVAWPLAVTMISARDLGWPSFSASRAPT